MNAAPGSRAISSATQIDFGGSPYVCGDPVRPDRSDVFYGREELLLQIRRQVIQSGNVILLEGNRRTGKSTILRNLEGTVAIPGWLAAYCSLQGAGGSPEGAGVPTVEVFREIANAIAKAVFSLGGETPLPDGSKLPPGKSVGIAGACRKGISEKAAFSDLRDYIEVIFHRLENEDLGIVLMLDEFDKLQEGIDNGITSPQVPENIRFLVHTYPRFSAILTGMRRLKRLREQYWSALFGLGTRFPVAALAEEAARRLVCEPVEGILSYSSEAVNYTVDLTARQPFLLQCLCSRIFDIAERKNIRSITADVVTQAAEALVPNNEHFAFSWDYVGSDRRRLILAILNEAYGAIPSRSGLGDIQEMLGKYGIEIDDESLIQDMEILRELELVRLVKETGGGRYEIAGPLLGMWITNQQDIKALISRASSEAGDTDD